MSKPSESWKFAEWFEAQHGKRPSPIDTPRLRDRIKSMEGALAADLALLAACNRWDERRTSALYAWQIRDGQKL